MADPVVQYVAFATAVGANINDPAIYIALPVVQTGVQPGIASSKLNNNAIRQACMFSAAWANVIAELTGQDVLDNGDLEALIALLKSTVSIGAATRPVRIVAASGAFVTNKIDYAIGLNRVAAVADSSTTLPELTDDDAGGSYKYQDLAGNFQDHALTVNAPAGHNIAGLASFICNENRQTAEFTFYGDNTWGVDT